MNYHTNIVKKVFPEAKAAEAWESAYYVAICEV